MMNQKLIENNYLLVPNFISSSRAKELSDNFNSHYKQFETVHDPQVDGCIAKYDFPPFIELLVEKNQTVCQLVGENVLPTYSYARNYRHGNILTGHVDKPQCEISLTVNLECDNVWDIWIETPHGREYVSLNPGDAMLYLGMEAQHGRDSFDGETCTQVFLHYVRSQGPFFKYYFDKDHRYRDDEPKKEVMEVKEVNNSQSTSNSLNDYIKVYNNIFTPDECKMILDEYVDCSDWETAKVSSDARQNRDVRNCDIISISMPDVIKEDSNRINIDQLIFKKANLAAKLYVKDFPSCFLKEDSGYDLLRYKTGGFYSQHTDSFNEQPRTVAMSINLNGDYEGGAMAFWNKELQIMVGLGDVILFPANFMYPHEIMEVTNGTRYSIVTWFS